MDKQLESELQRLIKLYGLKAVHDALSIIETPANWNRKNKIATWGALGPLELPVSVHNPLKQAGIRTIEDAVNFVKEGPIAYIRIRHFGEKSFMVLVQALRTKGYLGE